MLTALLLSAALHSQLIDVSDHPDGDYPIVVTVKGGQIVSARPLQRLKLSLGNDPDSPPPPPGPDPFVTAIKLNTTSALQAGGTKTTGAALSAVYSLVSEGVKDGSIAPDTAWIAVKQGTDLLMTKVTDDNAWTTWRQLLSDAVNKLKDEGKLKTKDEVAVFLSAVSKGLDAATGNTLDPRALAEAKSATALDTDGKADGIFDGIDLKVLIDLIKQIIELIKLFQGIGL